MSETSVNLINQRIVSTKRGGPETLELTQDFLADPKAGEIRIRVLAAGVLLGDVFWQKGLIPGAPKPPFTPGYDIVGVVDQVGAGVEGFSGGERVAAITGFGGYSRYVIVPAQTLVPVPDDISPATLSALIMSYLTAYQILRRVAQVKSGSLVLVHGAAGSTGSALLDLGRALGLKMWGTASQAKHEVIARYGAAPIDYQREDFVARLERDVPGGVDLVVDPIGGAHLDRSWRVLCRGGVLVATAAIGALHGASALATIGGFAKLWVRDKLPNGRSALLFNVVDSNKAHPGALAQDLEALISHLRAERITPLIAAELPLEQAARAQQLLITSWARGRVVLRPDLAAG